MLQLILTLCLGIILGRFFKRKSFKKLSSLITFIIALLLFVLGLEIGSNPDIIKNFDVLGWQALIIALASMAGSILFVKLFEYFVFRQTSKEIGKNER